ncbi:unnamed protein product [Chondrus crispus]|uniref:Protein kinase domain-containing protein n=1 Tax=Chondrus crispus TaxID=2769 RepID=R7Q2S1_CHOCR|nr:unnamed protein product [Chondrus crispus]CDF32188.1 unnamed protein product [Chondrus crispus]|eukprot:XP_005711853.1 unnamed protein product [Chondrus crispus]
MESSDNNIRASKNDDGSVFFPGRPLRMLESLLNDVKSRENELKVTRARIDAEEAALQKALINIKAENIVLDKERRRTITELNRALFERDRRAAAAVKPGTREKKVVREFKKNGPINDRWVVIDMIAQGSSSIVMGGVDMRHSNAVAIRYEPDPVRKVCLERDRIVYESRVLADNDIHKEHNPKVRYLGPALDGYVLIMDRLGPSLEDERPFWKHKVDHEAAMLIGCTIVGRLEALHRAGYVHGNIQPAHIVSDWKQLGGYHLISFSTAWNFICPITGNFQTMQPRTEIVGTPRYASILSHQRHIVDRCSDLESLGYVMVEMMTGSLPWSNLPEKLSATDHAKIVLLKRELATSKHVQGLPPRMIEYLLALKKLSFNQVPNYELFSSFLDSHASPKKPARSAENVDAIEVGTLAEISAEPGLPMSPPQRPRRNLSTASDRGLRTAVSKVSAASIPVVSVEEPMSPAPPETQITNAAHATWAENVAAITGSGRRVAPTRPNAVDGEAIPGRRPSRSLSHAASAFSASDYNSDVE